MRLFNIRPSEPDSRDFVYRRDRFIYASEVDLREWDSLVEDQGDLGSCSGNAMTNAYELMVKKQYPDKFVDLSRLFVYYNARVIESSIEEDTGVLYLRDIFRGVRRHGICKESLWPYDTTKFDVKPSDEAYEEAKKRNITRYARVPTMADMFELVDAGKPVVIGLDVFPEFMTLTKDDPIVPMPSDPLSSEGGHAMDIVGYSIPKKLLLAKNSFGTEWGDGGYCWLTFDYFKNYVFENWHFEINNQEEILVS